MKKSVAPNDLICLNDGRKFKGLKRRLLTSYNLSPGDHARGRACRSRPNCV
ncbi:MucR family transcriptional regulator [Bosea sp. 2YAB26]|uniref:MucR family transcriptional regulator n=1 Tax=Bosea sp. 2YAB26 TaxID=3237478 RepID=UPI003F92572C